MSSLHNLSPPPPEVQGLLQTQSKTKFSLFHKYTKRINPLETKIQNVIIERVQNFNFLGLVLNSTV